MDNLSYTNLTDQELSERLSKLNKRIAYVVRTNLHASTLPQMRSIQAHLLIEARSRMEKRKVDLYNQFFPGDSKIIGEEENDEAGK
tara:strand:- start:7345 stop:7602 length:258 start_codon:yes stop_codon:yes gene_type:complete